jgi:hypothetical protein
LHIVIASATEFALSFEEAAAALERLDRLHFEPDGSFVRSGTHTPTDAIADTSAQRWQLDGNLYDRDGRLQYVELKGTAPLAALEQLFAAIGWPATPLTFQIVQEGRTLDEPAFRSWLRGP